jgi:hypothetical protein
MHLLRQYVDLMDYGFLHLSCISGFTALGQNTVKYISIQKVSFHYQFTNLFDYHNLQIFLTIKHSTSYFLVYYLQARSYNTFHKARMESRASTHICPTTN